MPPLAGMVIARSTGTDIRSSALAEALAPYLGLILKHGVFKDAKCREMIFELSFDLRTGSGSRHFRRNLKTRRIEPVTEGARLLCSILRQMFELWDVRRD